MKRNTDPEDAATAIMELDDCILVVEGMRDERALKTLGLKNIVRISGVPFIRAVEAIQKLRTRSNKEVVILTDFDREGRKLAKGLSALLKKYKIHPNSRKRGRIMELGKTHIENLRNFFPAEAGIRKAAGYGLKKPLSKEDDSYVKIGTNVNEIPDTCKHKGERRDRKAGRHRRGLRSD